MGTLYLEQVYSAETQFYRALPRIWRDCEVPLYGAGRQRRRLSHLDTLVSLTFNGPLIRCHYT